APAREQLRADPLGVSAAPGVAEVVDGLGDVLGRPLEAAGVDAAPGGRAAGQGEDRQQDGKQAEHRAADHRLVAVMAERVSVPRGRHAPPLEVRLGVQRDRLLEAAAEVFARRGYAEASAEAISRAAGMSKATFYEHFANKEEAILALFDQAAEFVLTRMAEAAQSGPDDPQARVRAGLRAYVTAIAEHPAFAQTLLVEIIGAG